MVKVLQERIINKEIPVPFQCSVSPAPTSREAPHYPRDSCLLQYRPPASPLPHLSRPPSTLGRESLTGFPRASTTPSNTGY